MLRHYLILVVVMLGFAQEASASKAPTGNPKDFKVKTCLHSVSYAGFWRGQARLGVEEFLEKAKELGFDGVMLMAKRPQCEPSGLRFGRSQGAAAQDRGPRARIGLPGRIHRLHGGGR